MDVMALVGLGGIPFIQALTELVKGMFPGLAPRFQPGIAVLWGIIINVALAYMLHLELGVSVLIGVAAGLAAAGLYSYGANREKEVIS